MTQANGPRNARRAKSIWGAAAFGGASLLCVLAAAAGTNVLSAPTVTPMVSATAATTKPSAPLVIDGSAGGEEAATPPEQDVPAESADPSAPYVRESDTHLAQLKLLINKSSVLETRTPYKRVSVGQPDIADVNVLGPGRLLVTGKRAGQTQVIVWDDRERAQVMDVSVQVDVKALGDQLDRMFPRVKPEVTANNGEIVLRGNVPSIEVAEQIAEVAKSYGGGVHNFLSISGGQQVVLQVKFAEVSRAATDALGINTGFTDGKSFFGNNVGGINPFGTQVGPSGVGQILSSPTPGAGVTLFGQGLAGNTAFQYFIQALRANNLLRILAEPQLQAISGQEASFLAGGTIPIPVSEGGVGTGAAISIVEREYGVKLKFVPVVLGDGRIRLKVSPEVSDLDYANGVTLNGFVIPGLTQRKVTTTVELADGQSFAIAGLLNTSVATNKNVTPLLGDLPVIGPVFRTVKYSKKETEMVVMVTAHLVEAMNPADVPLLPGERWRDPTENELFFKQDLGGPVSNGPRSSDLIPAGGKPKRVAKFHGEYGFNPARSDDPGVMPMVQTGND